jgi:hypothetical protein
MRLSETIPFAVQGRSHDWLIGGNDSFERTGTDATFIRQSVQDKFIRPGEDTSFVREFDNAAFAHPPERYLFEHQR